MATASVFEFGREGEAGRRTNRGTQTYERAMESGRGGEELRGRPTGLGSCVWTRARADGYRPRGLGVECRVRVSERVREREMGEGGRREG